MVFLRTWENPPRGNFWHSAPSPLWLLLPPSWKLSLAWAQPFSCGYSFSGPGCHPYFHESWSKSSFHRPSTSGHHLIPAWICSRCIVRERVSENATPRPEAGPRDLALSLTTSTCSQRPPGTLVQQSALPASTGPSKQCSGLAFTLDGGWNFWWVHSMWLALPQEL